VLANGANGSATDGGGSFSALMCFLTVFLTRLASCPVQIQFMIHFYALLSGLTNLAPPFFVRRDRSITFCDSRGCDSYLQLTEHVVDMPFGMICSATSSF
jgi:hypothetical protein